MEWQLRERGTEIFVEKVAQILSYTALEWNPGLRGEKSTNYVAACLADTNRNLPDIPKSHNYGTLCTQLPFPAFFTVLSPICTSACDFLCIGLFASLCELLTLDKIQSDEIFYSESLLKFIGVSKKHANLTDCFIERSYDKKYFKKRKNKEIKKKRK